MIEKWPTIFKIFLGRIQISQDFLATLVFHPVSTRGFFAREKNQVSQAIALPGAVDAREDWTTSAQGHGAWASGLMTQVPTLTDFMAQVL